jgi:hypothetical protein
MKNELILCRNCGENVDNELYTCEICGNEICDMCAEVCKKCGKYFCNACILEHHGK